MTQINAYDDYGIPQGKSATGALLAGGTATAMFGRFGFTGQAWLPEVGLYHYKNRTYSPTLGRFMQADPIGYGDGVNLYAYVGGDPINFTDPLGLAAHKDERGAIKPTDLFSLKGFDNKGICDGCTVTVTATKIRRVTFINEGGGNGRGNAGEGGGGESGSAPTPHEYVIQQDTMCSASAAFDKLRAPGVSAPGAPYARSGTTPRINLLGNNPISQSVNPTTRTIKNVTLEGHSFYPGTVTIQVDPKAGGGSTITITGEGTGPNPGFNKATGYAIFGFAARSVAQSCAGKPTYTPVNGG